MELIVLTMKGKSLKVTSKIIRYIPTRIKLDKARNHRSSPMDWEFGVNLVDI